MKYSPIKVLVALAALLVLSCSDKKESKIDVQNQTSRPTMSKTITVYQAEG